MVEVRALATDAVILVDGDVVLIQRDHDPYEGHWVLPGGLVEPDETAREACIRETEEEVGMTVTADAFVGLYDDPDRDERGNVSAAFRCSPVGSQSPSAEEEARRVETFDPTGLPGMGFDHEQIVTDATTGGGGRPNQTG